MKYILIMAKGLLFGPGNWKLEPWSFLVCRREQNCLCGHNWRAWLSRDKSNWFRLYPSTSKTKHKNNFIGLQVKKGQWVWLFFAPTKPPWNQVEFLKHINSIILHKLNLTYSQTFSFIKLDLDCISNQIDNSWSWQTRWKSQMVKWDCGNISMFKISICVVDELEIWITSRFSYPNSCQFEPLGLKRN